MRGEHHQYDTSIVFSIITISGLFNDSRPRIYFVNSSKSLAQPTTPVIVFVVFSLSCSILVRVRPQKSQSVTPLIYVVYTIYSPYKQCVSKRIPIDFSVYTSIWFFFLRNLCGRFDRTIRSPSIHHCILSYCCGDFWKRWKRLVLAARRIRPHSRIPHVRRRACGHMYNAPCFSCTTIVPGSPPS